MFSDSYIFSSIFHGFNIPDANITMTSIPESGTLSITTNYDSVDGKDIENMDNLQQSKIVDELEGDVEGRFKDINSLSDDEVGPVFGPKKRIQRFSESESDESDISKCVDSTVEKENSQIYKSEPNLHSTSPKETKLTRIKRIEGSDSENNSSDKDIDFEDNVSIRKSLRKEDKESKLKNKFKNLLSHKNILKMSEDEDSDKKSYSNSESDDEFSCLKIKQKFKSGAETMKSICDPDTSDEDNIQPKSYKRKSKPKMTKSTSPKPVRMTPKQAMENMQKIKSESNRMLREKGVSLPYHRPKALTLKDILNRTKPAISSDGKTLPIKMNEEQLKQYAMSLEQRQKEVIELCKSDTEDEEVENVETSVHGDANENMTPSTETITKSILNCDKKSSSNIENSIKDNGGNINDITPDSSEILELAIVTDSVNNNITDTICDIDNPDGDSEKDAEKIVLQKSLTEESQNISLHYESEKIAEDKIESGTKEDVDVHQGFDDEDNKDDFSDCDVNMDEIDKIIEEAETNSSKTPKPIPKLTGAPGTVINLDDEETEPRKLSGVELLKERFTFFAKIKTVEDIDKDREKKYKPGTQHLKLKQELEEQIAEQRSLEWEKRLQEEKQLKSEINDEGGDDIEKIESKMEEMDNEEEREDESSESEEELLENDVVVEDKPKRKNPMLDDEAEVSEDENGDEVVEDDESDEESDTDDSGSETDNLKPKKGRILKAFEDSDDEKENEATNDDSNKIATEAMEVESGEAIISESQDEELPLAQMNNSSDDLFSSQSTQPEPAVPNSIDTQTICLSNPELSNMIIAGVNPDNMNVCGTQNDEALMDDIVGMCSGSFSQNLVTSQTLPATQSQEFGDDIADMCTGKFYDNPLVSQENNSQEAEPEDESQDVENSSLHEKESDSKGDEYVIGACASNANGTDTNKENTMLNSILDELDDLDDKPKENKYFMSDAQAKELKKKFTIESDDETDDSAPKKIKKFKKKKAEQRALHISDDEDDEIENEESDIEAEDDNRIVEYDSEENEIEVKQPTSKPPKKGIRDFFENEAELSSEDEWIGSGDEDERGLDRMEREEGDDDTFHQGRLRRELGQIHMREVLDQDKREVRLLQELLFEDGDLGDGHRQRKFRWKNADGEEETGTYPEGLKDTQDEEFESEEQWRKERHEREMFIRQMREKDAESDITTNRRILIKENLSSPNVSSLITDTKDKPVLDRKTAKDIPSPKKGFTILKQNYHTSLLTRGRGALARLAALATPLADDDTPRNISNNRGNFVFAAITPNNENKVTTKRKAEVVHTERLIKKLKTDDSNFRKPSLFDHIKI